MSKVKFYTGNPLCQAVDFLYVADLNSGSRVIERLEERIDHEQQGDYYLPLSIISFVNISPEFFSGDLPVFCDIYLLDRLSPDLLNHIRSGKCRILIDYSGEAAIINEEVLISFHRELELREIDACSVVLINENHQFATEYENWCNRVGVSPIHVIAYNHALYHFSGTIRCAQPAERDARLEGARFQLENSIQKPRAYVCLNNMARPHRLALVSYLLHRGWAGRGFLSLLQPVGTNLRDAYWADISALVGPELARETFDDVLARTPFEAGASIHVARGDLAGRLGGDKIYAESYVSFVTESEFSAGSVRRFTEKVLKPIVNLQPFLVFGNPGTLKLLRNEGFETFSPLICEDYDEIEDPVSRFGALLREVDRICGMTAEELHELWASLWDRLRANYVRLWDLQSERYVTDPVHDRLSSILRSNVRVSSRSIRRQPGA